MLFFHILAFVLYKKRRKNKTTFPQISTDLCMQTELSIYICSQIKSQQIKLMYFTPGCSAFLAEVGEGGEVGGGWLGFQSPFSTEWKTLVSVWCIILIRAQERFHAAVS